jgi:5'-phosphate synthase pdxT subunit
MKIGVLALQGDFAEHIAMLKRLKVETSEVRLPEHLKGLDGSDSSPAGESTTIGKLAVAYNLVEPLKLFGQRHAIWGTCAGAIFISKDVSRDQPLLELMDIKVERNAFGARSIPLKRTSTSPNSNKPQGQRRTITRSSSVRRSLSL